MVERLYDARAWHKGGENIRGGAAAKVRRSVERRFNGVVGVDYDPVVEVQTGERARYL
ncbi:hypothetical protein QFZ34_001426 [Phyllobacterium ifriqiyense]|uniref:Uncharacterized protein n=1 Tax=Phyllobacterium ifriqiyense TaxID=314238 RepID=A0ABU0S688_9HYPH|nr:hypothetical protein [Phyllobacterium ifriqiyense]